MSVKVNLDLLLKEREMTSKELAEKIGITEANLSILRSGKARAIRFETLNKICFFLDCNPGELVTFTKGKNENE
jgi:putative transcriptional regulator